VLNRDVTLRMPRRKPLKTDEGHYILDLHLRRIGNPRQLALVLNQIPGVVENGLFIDICDVVVIGHGDGRVTVRDINSGRVDDGLGGPGRQPQHLRRSGLRSGSATVTTW
jgi:ribose 5-phosphate isomerase A